MRKGTLMQTISHWIGGQPVAGSSDRTADVTNPATGQVEKRVPLADKADAELAIASAKAASSAWAGTSIAKRASVLFAFRELLNARKPELAAIITGEHGKVLSDALGEVSRGQEVVEFACGIAHLMKGAHSTSISTGVDSYSKRQPVGVAAIISPFNFPAMVPMWFFPIAIAAGNAVILKPSEKDPSAANWVAELWKEAGLPDGVFNVLHGDKVAVDALLESPDVDSVSFVGSTPIAKYVYERGTAHGKRVQSLGGAKNHMIVMPDADLDLAADAAVSAGYGSAGERCMAISIAVVIDEIADEFIGKVADRTLLLTTGDGHDKASEMGPLISLQHRDRVAGLVRSGVEDGAELVIDGTTVKVEDREDGFWLGPTLFDRVTPDMAIYQEEIFGPVLGIIRVATFAEAVELINANPYGNGTAIFTNDGGVARRFENEIEVGMIGINVPIPVPTAYYSFGGWKNSLFGDCHAHGIEGIHFFTRGKVVTARWTDPANRPVGGVELGFPQNA